MIEKYRIRTDLALEQKERFAADNLDETYDEEREIRVTTVKIETENGAKIMGKPVGTYITMEAPDLAVPDEGYHEEISAELAKFLKPFVPMDKPEYSVLVAGLGNRYVTPDALGAYVADHLNITRHIVIKQTKPDLLIVVDALAARSTRRLNRTIQISDTGIHPGSGVGNHRNAITKETVGVPVISIGVPTVVDAATIVNDTMENFIRALESSETLKGVGVVLSGYNAAEKYELVKELISPHLNGLFVTPKDIDDTIRRISFTISEALNLLFSGGQAHNPSAGLI